MLLTFAGCLIANGFITFHACAPVTAHCVKTLMTRSRRNNITLILTFIYVWKKTTYPMLCQYLSVNNSSDAWKWSILQLHWNLNIHDENINLQVHCTYILTTCNWIVYIILYIKYICYILQIYHLKPGDLKVRMSLTL